MADSSFEIDYYSSGHYPPRGNPPTPVCSRNTSRSFAAASSSRSNLNSRRGRRSRATTTSDDDHSWQTEVSWQFEPTGWREYSNRNLGSVLSPWAASPSPSDRSRIFIRSAKDYYHSRTSGLFRGSGSAKNSYSENSGYAVPSGRVELQSYVAKEDDDQRSKSYNGFSKLEVIKEGIVGTRKGKNSPLAAEDELSFTSFSMGHDRELSYAKHDKYGDYDGHYVADHGLVVPSHGIGSHGSGRGYSHYGIDKVSGFDGDGGEEMDDGDDDDVEPAKSVGLLSLFRYSTMWDIVLVILGCLGALINGGSLPWYSFLFGKLVTKIATESKDGGDKSQMTKDVEKVSSFFSFPS